MTHLEVLNAYTQAIKRPHAFYRLSIALEEIFYDYYYLLE